MITEKTGGKGTCRERERARIRLTDREEKKLSMLLVHRGEMSFVLCFVFNNFVTV